PGEALAHRLDRYKLRKFQQNVAFAGRPGALHELHHADLEAMTDGAKDHAEGGRRLALALAGMDDQEAALLGLGGEDATARRLLLAHLVGVIGVTFRLGHQVCLLETVIGLFSHLGSPRAGHGRSWSAEPTSHAPVLR